MRLRHLVLAVALAVTIVSSLAATVTAAPGVMDPGVLQNTKAEKEQAKRDAEAKKDGLNRCKRGWATLARAESPHEAFTGLDACVSYVNGGGSLVAYTPPPPAISIGFRLHGLIVFTTCYVDVGLTNLDPIQTYTAYAYRNDVLVGDGGVVIVPLPDGTASYTAMENAGLGDEVDVHLFDANGTLLALASGVVDCVDP